MSEITETEIYHMTKEQNYMRGYEDGSKDTREKAYQQGRADAIDEFADNMQLVKLVECDDIPRELVEAIEKQIGICALRVKEKMLKE